MRGLITLVLGAVLVLAAWPSLAEAQVRLPMGTTVSCTPADNNPTVSSTNLKIDGCLASLRAEMDEHEEIGNRLAGVSALGGLGAVASGLTGQAAGTLNAWVGVGLAPAIYDEVQQRRRIDTLRRDTMSLLEQLRCRATYLDTSITGLSGRQKDLDRLSWELIDMVEALLARASLANPAANTPNGALRLIALEGRRVAGAARDLSDRMLELPTQSRVAGLQATIYDNILAERDDLLSAGRASPFNVFRSVLAAPFNAAGTFISGRQQGAPPTYSPEVATQQGGLTVNYMIDFPESATTPIAWVQSQSPPPPEAVAAADRQLAHDIQARTRVLAQLGRETMRDFSRFVDVAERGNNDCPRRQVLTGAGKPVTPASPAAPMVKS